jgi:uncharacterized protein involved in cysteine biosynthesis
MVAQAFLLALDQLTDRKFLKVFLTGTLIAVVVFVGLFTSLAYLVPEDIAIFDWEWLNEALSWIIGWSIWPVVGISAYLLFPAVSTAFMSLFLDDVVAAVEAKHYPDRPPMRQVGAGESFLIAARMSIVVILLNLLALPFYFLLLFTAVGPFILFFLLNSYLIGREYFELVASRHMEPKEAAAFRRRRRDRSFLCGGVIVGLFVVPLVNLFAPIIGAAMMVHVFHQNLAEESAL